MIGDLMRRILEKVDQKERADMLSRASREYCGMALETGEALDVGSLLEMLAPTPRLMLSELLAAKAQTIDLPTEETAALQLKALRLLASLYSEGSLCELRAQRLMDLKSAVLTLLTAEDLIACARFFSQAERYDEMEDALYEALDQCEGETRAHCRQEAIALLRNAAKANGQTLALCHMTDSELRQSAHELEAQTDDITHEQENPV